MSAKTLERIVHDEGYFPRSDTLEKIDAYIDGEDLRPPGDNPCCES